MGDHRDPCDAGTFDQYLERRQDLRLKQEEKWGFLCRMCNVMSVVLFPEGYLGRRQCKCPGCGWVMEVRSKPEPKEDDDGV